jgi:hypothetical protein
MHVTVFVISGDQFSLFYFTNGINGGWRVIMINIRIDITESTATDQFLPKQFIFFIPELNMSL